MSRSGSGPGDGPLLALDTATEVALVALGGRDGALRAAASWTAGYRHSEELLARLDSLLEAEAVDLAAVTGIVVGTGPGAFTGLRVGLATAKGLAHGLAVPILGISTGAALLEAARTAGLRRPLALLLPAGPTDRVLVIPAPEPSHGHVVARRLAGDEEPDVSPGTTLVAVDLADRVPDSVHEAGVLARAGLAAALLRLAADRLEHGDTDDAATLVPEYVTLPRGVARDAGRITMGRV